MLPEEEFIRIKFILLNPLQRVVLTITQHTLHTYFHGFSHQDQELDHVPLCILVFHFLHMAEKHYTYPERQEKKFRVIFIEMLITLLSYIISEIIRFPCFRLLRAEIVTHTISSVLQYIIYILQYNPCGSVQKSLTYLLTCLSLITYPMSECPQLAQNLQMKRHLKYNQVFILQHVMFQN